MLSQASPASERAKSKQGRKTAKARRVDLGGDGALPAQVMGGATAAQRRRPAGKQRRHARNFAAASGAVGKIDIPSNAAKLAYSTAPLCAVPARREDLRIDWAALPPTLDPAAEGGGGVVGGGGSGGGGGGSTRAERKR